MHVGLPHFLQLDLSSKRKISSGLLVRDMRRSFSQRMVCNGVIADRWMHRQQNGMAIDASFVLRAGHHQFALVNAFQALQLCGDLLQAVSGTAEDDDLQAQIVCQMDVRVARGRTSTGWRSSPAKTAIGGSRFWSS